MHMQAKSTIKHLLNKCLSYKHGPIWVNNLIKALLNQYLFSKHLCISCFYIERKQG